MWLWKVWLVSPKLGVFTNNSKREKPLWEKLSSPCSSPLKQWWWLAERHPHCRQNHCHHHLHRHRQRHLHLHFQRDHHRPWNPAVNFVLLLQSIDGDWKSGRARSRSERRHNCVAHVSNEPGGRGWGKHEEKYEDEEIKGAYEENICLTWTEGNAW